MHKPFTFRGDLPIFVPSNTGKNSDSPSIFPCGTLYICLAWQLMWKKPYSRQSLTSVTCLHYAWLDMDHFLNFKKKPWIKICDSSEEALHLCSSSLYSLKAHTAILPPFSQLSSQGALNAPLLLNWEKVSIIVLRNTTSVLVKTLVSVEQEMLCPVSQKVKIMCYILKAAVCPHFTISYINDLTKAFLL